MEQWIQEIINHPVVTRMLPRLGKEDYDRVLLSARLYPDISQEDTVFLIDVLKICAEKMGVI
jgi:hypothetical protein